MVVHPPAGTQAGNQVIDLRSDTVTKPTEAMYERMRSAPLGDDGLDGDPTALDLERRTADLLGKEAGVFVPTCTMANLIAVLVQAQRADQILVGDNAHMLRMERGTSVFTGVCVRAVPGTAGAMDRNAVAEILTVDRGRIATALICLETSHNAAGGTVLPLAHMQAIRELANEDGIRVHVDGARIFNAAVALDIAPDRIASHADTVAICLSKGLSAPAGAVLAGPAETIRQARQMRKLLGGTQRQIGVLAAAGIEAIEVMRHRLGEDHARAARFSKALNAAGTTLRASAPETNIVQVDVSKTGRTSFEWVDALTANGVLTRTVNPALLRCVTHRHISEDDIDRAADVFLSLAGRERAA
ncbi:threonine aldolase [Rhodobium orientis]|uniref:Threonine aldolase n=2 Tax=Rhodobium orientis TaxID=34017 RepID=A0A327JX95_9HYPH|nr:GntG family PLP-dependent aldolase [Rhodobium orientis]MBB4301099.1 threonine aldolase [Rhodobium orientis]MBK5949766.1 threonine aldolase [Rhodobium orientis]RAI30123.1 threonine aldolase [Rhodobium orientis]